MKDISEKINDHEKKINAAYTAIALLRQQGIKLSTSKVAETAQIARSTLYTNHPDWKEIRSIISKNSDSPRIKIVTKELTEKQIWERQIDQVERKVDGIHEELKEIRNVADGVYEQLLTQLHRYFILSKETPREVEKKAQVALDNVRLSERLERLEAEYHRLKVEQGLQGTLLPFSKKEVIHLCPVSKRPTLKVDELLGLGIDAINELDEYFHNKEFAPNIVYVMCGQFACGKSKWINDHKPQHRGTVLYIDGTNHTIAMRSLFLKRIKKLNRECHITCCRIFTTTDVCLERNQNETRKRMGLTVSDALIRQVEAACEEVKYDEGFDAIELVGARL